LSYFEISLKLRIFRCPYLPIWRKKLSTYLVNSLANPNSVLESWHWKSKNPLRLMYTLGSGSEHFGKPDQDKNRLDPKQCLRRAATILFFAFYFLWFFRTILSSTTKNCSSNDFLINKQGGVYCKIFVFAHDWKTCLWSALLILIPHALQYSTIILYDVRTVA
jgi:hypothetical protein